VTEKATVASYLVNGFAAAFGLVTMEILAVTIGIIMCFATYATTLYYQKRKDRRDLIDCQRKAEIHNLQLEQFRRNNKSRASNEKNCSK
jgi:predicted membrane protein